jgi:hypothetical protein
MAPEVKSSQRFARFVWHLIRQTKTATKTMVKTSACRVLVHDRRGVTALPATDSHWRSPAVGLLVQCEMME